MATAQPPSSRASLLSGLRTGGVRSASTPLSAGPGASFNIPSFAQPAASRHYPQGQSDEIGSIMNRAPLGDGLNAQIPITAAVDSSNAMFSQQQSKAPRVMNPNSVPFNPAFNISSQCATPQAQVQALQMQMMQLEILRLQTIQAQQAQQYQAEVLAQVQRQQNRRASASVNPPASAGPLSSTFDLRSATLRRATQAELLKSQLSVCEEQVPMSAAIGGKFASRASSATPPAQRFASDDGDDEASFANSQTTVISGGTLLGSSTSNNAISATPPATVTPSKSDAAASWRRGGSTNSTPNGNRNVTVNTSPSVKITPPPSEGSSPPPSATSTKARPLPLRLDPAASQPLPAVTIVNASDASDTADDTSSTGSYKSGSGSSPSTPGSPPSSNDMPLSPREEATKKLYAGLGIGRPAPTSTTGPTVVSHRMASQPLRQPRGPPSGADELGPKNFATRIRRKAIGGLGALMDARERREIVEAY